MVEVASVVLRYTAQGAAEAAKADKGVRESNQETVNEVRKTQPLVHRWMAQTRLAIGAVFGQTRRGISAATEWLTANKTAVMAIGTALLFGLAAITAASPVMQAQLGNVRTAFSVLADSVAIHLEPALTALEQKIYDVEEAYSSLPEPVQKGISFTLGFAGAVGSLLLVLGLFAGPTAKGVMLALAGISASMGFLRGLAWLLVTPFIRLAFLLGGVRGVIALTTASTLALAAAVGAAIGGIVVWVLEVTGALDAMQRFGEAARNNMSPAVRDLHGILTSLAVGPLAIVGGLIVGLVRGDGLKGALENSARLTAQFAGNWIRTIARIRNAIENSRIVDALGGIVAGTRRMAEDWISSARDWGLDIAINIARGLEDGVGIVGNASKKVLGSIKDWISFDEAENDREARRWGMDLGRHFVAGLGRVAGSVGDASASLVQPLASPTAAPISNISRSSQTTMVRIEAGAITIQGSGNGRIDEERLLERLARRVAAATRNRSPR